ncbi:hydrogenase maturation protein HypF [Kibdelosporangium banguiense]|uniref:Carbamoyltransferase n=1 Tax=Kibdelosporangium banguiense TaxID=1365924 RepID=A0ABS4T6H6_9PSEU|nr:carbamoyltransferase HypF [Kibdelosporangium banguiense]MBP2320025.1 hydrogenase maturation protein HypF [Kibdelosporangium banguiense]
MTRQIRRDVRVEGVVQGVGFRPFVYSLATGLGLAGRVGNDVDGVFVEIEGPGPQVDAFLVALRRDAPPLAEIERITVATAEVSGTAGFTIAPSEAGGVRRTLVSADTATCADCLRELHDPSDRRFGYAFINCTNCGPRFTIIQDVPYDRPFTTMAGFEMCAACAEEYHDPGNRRFHAQPTCCPACGPQLSLVPRNGDPITGCAELLLAGKIVAIKGLGGYHLSALATDETATAELRRRKHREDKPFAVMVSSVDEARRLCEVDDPALLTQRARPIVLLPKRTELAAAVAPGNRHLGIMLAYTPLHHLLLEAVAAPIVLTSGNVSDEPIAYEDDDAFDRLAGIADAFLTHDRAIHIRTDDSVIRPSGVVRRSRGFAPEPVSLPWRADRSVLACGAELKNTFCLLKEQHAFVSHHIGDLENYETLRSFTSGIEHFSRLFDIRPQVVAHDLHPEYLSTKYALELIGVDLIGVQHHHAHIVSCLADNGIDTTVIGVAFDGLGYGTDGTIWGGEFLLADRTSFQRIGHLAPIPMPGGTAAIKQPWRMAAAYLDAAYSGNPPERLMGPDSQQMISLARSGINSPLTSSAGRLFDAAAALVGVRDTVNYEGQAAIEFEQLADPGEQGAYQAAILDGVVSGVDIIRSVAEDLLADVPPAVIAGRFHNSVARIIAESCARARDEHDVSTVALSGGVFQNMLLRDRAVDLLTRKGFRVLTHSRVPTNDGGISLGQAVIAATVK